MSFLKRKKVRRKNINHIYVICIEANSVLCVLDFINYCCFPSTSIIFSSAILP